jgi:hypothetical protein
MALGATRAHMGVASDVTMVAVFDFFTVCVALGAAHRHALAVSIDNRTPKVAMARAAGDRCMHPTVDGEALVVARQARR